MRREAVISVLLLGAALGGCSWRKPKQTQAPPAPKPVAQSVPVQKTPPPPLSVPQTRVTLPEPQPLDPEALATAPVPQPRTETPPPSRPARRQPAAIAPQPRPEPPPPAAPVAAAEERPPVQAVVPAEQQRQFQEQAQNWKREVRQVLQKLQRRSLNRHDRDLRDRIESFLKQSDEAEQRGDMRQAAALADRAQVLSREFHSGR